MASLRSVIVTAAVALLVGAGGALTFAWHEWRPKTVVETPAVGVRQSDSSLVIQRAPDAHAKPAQEIPKGATVERVVHVEVQPHASSTTQVDSVEKSVSAGKRTDSVSLKVGTSAGVMGEATPARAAPEVVACPPVGVDLTLLRLKDGTQRVVASSKDGIVLDSLSVDHPVVDVAPARALVWSAGPIWGGGDNGFGANVTRDLGFTRIVGAVMRAPARGPIPVHAVGLIGVNVRF